MCIIGAALQAHRDFPFILAANRDEFIERPAEKACRWEEGFIAGKDLRQGGTWLGISLSGRIAAVTNIRNPEERQDYPKSRGELVPAWLKEKPLEEMLKAESDFAGFNFLYGDKDKLHYATNGDGIPRTIEKGIFALSNAELGAGWPKTEYLQQELERGMGMEKRELVEHLFSALSRKKTFPEKELPDTGVGLELEKNLSPPYINMEEYGTRCSTVILIDRMQRVTFIERSHRPEQAEVCFQFSIGKSKNS